MTDEQLTADFVAERWPLTKVKLGATIRQFGARAVRIVEAAEGRFVVKTTDQWRDDRDAAMHLALFDILGQRAFEHIPQLLRTRSNQPMAKSSGTRSRKTTEPWSSSIGTRPELARASSTLGTR